jgi:hypothetical protein
MTSFSPLNVYTFAAARGEFLRPDVRALLAAGRKRSVRLPLDDGGTDWQAP